MVGLLLQDCLTLVKNLASSRLPLHSKSSSTLYYVVLPLLLLLLLMLQYHCCQCNTGYNSTGAVLLLHYNYSYSNEVVVALY
jgi:hypothetical protein